MKTISKEIRSQRERLQSFRSVEALSQKAARRAKTVRQKEFAKSFREQEALRAQFDSVMKKIHGPVRELLAKDPRVATSRGELRKLNSICANGNYLRQRYQRTPRVYSPVSDPRSCLRTTFCINIQRTRNYVDSKCARKSVPAPWHATYICG